jgi:ABC-type microcin C transport system duplicated ATPase subunit YejF
VALARCLTLNPEVRVMKDGGVVEQAGVAQILAAPQEDCRPRRLAAAPRGYHFAWPPSLARNRLARTPEKTGLGFPYLGE